MIYRILLSLGCCFFFYQAKAQSEVKIKKILQLTSDMEIVNELASIVGKDNPAFVYVIFVEEGSLIQLQVVNSVNF